MRVLNNINQDYKKITLFENNNNLNKEVITDNEIDLFKILNKQTVNNFNNKYRIIYKSKIPKKRSKILKIFEMLKKGNVMARLNKENKIKGEHNNNNSNKIINRRISNSVPSDRGRHIFNKKMVDISIGTEDSLPKKIFELNHKLNGKGKILTIHSLDLTNIN